MKRIRKISELIIGRIYLIKWHDGDWTIETINKIYERDTIQSITIVSNYVREGNSGTISFDHRNDWFLIKESEVEDVIMSYMI